MSAGDRYTAKKLKAARAATRETTFADPNVSQTGWHENPIAMEGSKAGLLETVMRQLMARPTQLEQPDEAATGVPARPICTTALK